MKFFVVGNLTNVGEAMPAVTTGLATSEAQAIDRLLEMPGRWGADWSLETGKREFQSGQGTDPYSLTPEKVAELLSSDTSHYFVETHES